MRAGSLDRTITLLARTDGEPDAAGTVTSTWAASGTFRASIVMLSSEEFLRAYGEISEAVVIFRARWLQGVTNANRIGYDGKTYDVKETKEIGRREGLEIRCEEVRS